MRLLLALAMLIAACTPGAGGPSAAPTSGPAFGQTSAPAATGTASPATAGVSNPPGPTFWIHLSDAGYLVDDAGMSLYTFDSDTGDTSTCYGQCAESWPPAVTPGMVARNTGVTGTADLTSRTDGTAGQVRYNGDPLYYFAGDSAPGDTNGDGVGGVWHLARASVTASPSAAPGSPPASAPGGGGCDPASDPYCY